jgi:epoxyqueuosine reductase
MLKAHTPSPEDLVVGIKAWALELGFDEARIADCDLSIAAPRLDEWLAAGFSGEMSYMSDRAELRKSPTDLVEGVKRIISLRMNYFVERDGGMENFQFLEEKEKGFVARYALARDYHKILRKRLELLARRIKKEIGPFGYRVFTDSAPVMEVELATKAGLGWRGKHSLLINKNVGSWFFLGEIFTDLELPLDRAKSEHCGSCTKCIDICPTGAIVGPFKVDARRCISYLTIEHKTSIPRELRSALGNRIYGCDDCQLVCPWNKYAESTVDPDFKIRKELDGSSLVEFFSWSKEKFLKLTEGSAIRRIGHERWLRNIACALGNALATPDVISALEARKLDDSALVREHVEWALEEQSKRVSA